MLNIKVNKPLMNLHKQITDKSMKPLEENTVYKPGLYI